MAACVRARFLATDDGVVARKRAADNDNSNDKARRRRRWRR